MAGKANTTPSRFTTEADIGQIDDRGLEMAEALIHERRYLNDLQGRSDETVDRALMALDGVRRLSKR